MCVITRFDSTQQRRDLWNVVQKPRVCHYTKATSVLNLSRKGDDMVDTEADADFFTNSVVVMARDIGNQFKT